MNYLKVKTMMPIDDKNKKIPSSLDSDLTTKRRNELIENEEYINKEIYNSRYKLQDIKDELKSSHLKKCAFCEQIQEQMQVEHFRPKSRYYWLAYSWDNLLWSCAVCNQSKGNKFPIARGRRVVFSVGFMNAIHSSCANYDKKEKTLLINPSSSGQLHRHFSFNEMGEIIGETAKGRTTIKVCKLDRKDLNERRKIIFDNLNEAINITRNESGEDGVKRVILTFIESAKNSSQSEFVAYRRYIVRYLIKKM